LLLADDDADDADDVNNINNADVNNADNEKRKRKSSIEEEKRSRLDTSLDRVERLVMCCFFVLLAVSKAKSIRHLKIIMINVITYTSSVETSFKLLRVISRALYFNRKSSELNLYEKTHINDIEF
jgi:hypothetical protein